MSASILPQRSLHTDTPATPLLVYRDRIGAPSEIQFLRRQYVGFTRLTPVWVGRHVMPQAPALGGQCPLARRRGAGRLAAPRPVPPVAAARRRIPLAHIAPVLHAQFARGGALALPLAQALGLRLVVTLHGGDVSKAKNWRGTVQARRWPAVVAAAIALRLRLCRGRRRGAARTACHETSSPCCRSAWRCRKRPPPPPPGPPCHLFVGRFVPKKGIVVLADAVRHLRAAGDTTPIVCIGDGPQRPALDALARDAGGVTLTGWLPPEAVAARMAQAWSLLVPSIIAADGDAEGLPSVIPEAMAQACPIIGSAQGGIAEAVQHGQTGLLVPPGDPIALAEAMHRLVSEPQLRHGLGQTAFAFVRAHLNARVQSAALENLLLEVGT